MLRNVGRPTLARTAFCSILWLFLLIVMLPAQSPSSGPSLQQIEFFEKKIRPVLVERCQMCHGSQAATVQGGLRLDTREGLRKGGNSGAAIVPGEPDKSLLIHALRYQNKALQMPPGERLSAAQVSDFENWVKMGAPDPREDATQTKPAGRPLSHWSFQPAREPPLPEVKNRAWAKGPVDRFILAGLEVKGLSPSAAADKRTLIRRATYDLTGLPPTFQEVEAFLADGTPDALARVVDRLLASPHYGERWGRHWLDVARYADTKSGGGRFPFAYTYRDWVIQAFNDDMPYDQFLMWQIAADRLVRRSSFDHKSLSFGKGGIKEAPPSTDTRHLAALGFITLGRDFPNSPHEMIDDRIDVVTRSTLGLTVSCARCHDHKYDPIPTRDYYSLYGVFANASEPNELPLLAKPSAPGKRDSYYDRGLRERLESIAEYRKRRYEVLLAELRTAPQIAAYLLGAEDARDMGNTELETFSRDRDLNLFLLRRWRAYLSKTKESRDPVFALWHSLPEARSNPLVEAAFTEKRPSGPKEAAEVYASLIARFDNLAPFASTVEEAFRRVLRAPDAPMNVQFSELDQILTEGDRNNLRDLRIRVEKLLVDYAYRGAQSRAMALADGKEILPAHILVRGNPNNLGAEVPRRFLAVLAGENSQPFQDGSGRLDLARAIASKDNPLTARVLVNRIWHHHFGAGLVRTTSDFGLRGDLPSHPELLDYLAVRAMEEGWSLKKLHRLILLSNTYQQSSQDNPEARRIDPENRQLWRMNRWRLDFESLRDSLLAVSGQLDRTMGGLPLSITSQPSTRRRSVYAFIDRARLPGVFQTFDFASPDQHSPQRFLTTIPQQALFMMNSPFVAEQARYLAARAEVTLEQQPQRRIQALYRLAFGREANPLEIEQGLKFVASETEADSAPAVPPAQNWQYGTGRYDITRECLKDFRPFQYFTGDSWQSVPLLPAPELGNARLTSDGGEATDQAGSVVVRRWVAPIAGQVSISGVLRHRLGKFSKGDGLRARIVSSRAGELASWTAKGLEAETKLGGVEVKPGDTLDFIVDGRQDAEDDSFAWAPLIERAPGEGSQERPMKWSASADFRGPDASRLSRWEQYAQVLLQTNEFAFVE